MYLPPPPDHDDDVVVVVASSSLSSCFLSLYTWCFERCQLSGSIGSTRDNQPIEIEIIGPEFFLASIDDHRPLNRRKDGMYQGRRSNRSIGCRVIW